MLNYINDTMIDWSDFTKMNTDEWMQKADLDSKGKYQAADFAYAVENDFSVNPFLTSSPEHDLTLDAHFSTKCGIMIDGSHVKQANQIAHQHLASGVESLVFLIDGGSDISSLLHDIQPQYVSIMMLVRENLERCQQNLYEYFQKNNSYSPENIVITTPKNLKQDWTFKERILQANIWMVNEDEMTIVVEPKKDFLAQIAEFRALRMIWKKHKKPSQNLKIVSVSKVSKQDQDLHPLIIENYKLMSAYLGMCDVVCIENSDDKEMVRLLINVMYIFKHEAKLNVVIDPVKGSYIIEELTSKMINMLSNP